MKYFKLLLKAIQVRCYELYLAIKGIKNWRPRFFLAEILNISLYSRRSPYRVSRIFHEQLGDANIYCYGNTPLITLRQMVEAAKITKKDVFFDAGSGTGRNVFWISSFSRCKTVGIEQISEFVVKSRIIAKLLWYKNTRFIFGDMFKTLWPSPTVVYLYNFMLTEQELTTFAKQCTKLPKSARIITISISLDSYNSNAFEQIYKEIAIFPWGQTDMYVFKVK